LAGFRGLGIWRFETAQAGTAAKLCHQCSAAIVARRQNILRGAPDSGNQSRQSRLSRPSKLKAAGPGCARDACRARRRSRSHCDATLARAVPLARTHRVLFRVTRPTDSAGLRAGAHGGGACVRRPGSGLRMTLVVTGYAVNLSYCGGLAKNPELRQRPRGPTLQPGPGLPR
jgi:class 3 adenylate cyclase